MRIVVGCDRCGQATGAVATGTFDMAPGRYIYCMECAADEPDDVEVEAARDEAAAEAATEPSPLLLSDIIKGPSPSAILTKEMLDQFKMVEPSPQRGADPGPVPPIACLSTTVSCRCGRLMNHKGMHRCGCGQEWP